MEKQTMGMTVLDRLLSHDAWTTRQLLLRCQPLSDEQMQREFDIDNKSLSATLGHLIGAMEYHTDRLLGRTISASYRQDTSVDGMLVRLTAVAKDFAAFATKVEREGREDEMMTNEKGENLRTLGGVIAHVITHNMHHRAQAMYIMTKLGIADILEGDVLGWEAIARGWGWVDGGSTGTILPG
jgi:uncharacterized damage-inducible protein DinB